MPELLGAPEYNKEGWPRVVKASVSRETPTKVALRHRAKNDATTKRRRSAVAGQHESNGTDYWKQNQFQLVRPASRSRNVVLAH